MAQNLDLGYFLVPAPLGPAPLGAEAKTRLGSRINKFNPVVFAGQDPVDALRLFTSKRAHTETSNAVVPTPYAGGVQAGVGESEVVFERLGEIDAHTNFDSVVVQKALQQNLQRIRSTAPRFEAPRSVV